MGHFYSNENFPMPVVTQLRELGHNIVTIQERGRGGEAVSDPEVPRLANDEGRAVLTLNRKDFIRLHNESEAHAGIVVCTVAPDFAGQAIRIHEAITAYESLHGQLIRVNRPS